MKTFTVCESFISAFVEMAKSRLPLIESKIKFADEIKEVVHKLPEKTPEFKNAELTKAELIIAENTARLDINLDLIEDLPNLRKDCDFGEFATYVNADFTRAWFIQSADTINGKIREKEGEEEKSGLTFFAEVDLLSGKITVYVNRGPACYPIGYYVWYGLCDLQAGIYDISYFIAKDELNCLEQLESFGDNAPNYINEKTFVLYHNDNQEFPYFE
ncbi:TPA: hypothetical protein KMU33_003333 [Escherichia coli]|nr:hypothetical protein [Escherichia coli]TZB43672.1 hypothetical protein E0K73_23290 [Escherichia coli]HBE7366373.1 hypothetical protein [Escherichia coli]